MPENDIATPVDPGMATVVHQEVPTPEDKAAQTDTGVLEAQPGQDEAAVGPAGPAESEKSGDGMLPSSIITPGGYVGD